MSMYCDARPSAILFGSANPFGANRARLARENAHAKAADTLVGRSFVFPLANDKRVTVQIIKATKANVQVRPCFDLGEPACGLQRGETLTIPATTALAFLNQPDGPM